MLFQTKSEKRISLIASAILVTLTLAASFSVYWVMRNQPDAQYSRSVQLDLESRLRLFEFEIQQHVANALTLTQQRLTQEKLTGAFEAAGIKPTPFLDATLKTYLGQGASALLLYDNQGHEVARAGWKAQPQFDVPLILPHPTRLGWDEGFTLSTRVDVIKSGHKLGALLVENRLSDFADARVERSQAESATTMILCATLEHGSIRCFPSAKAVPEIKILASDKGARAMAMRAALAGKSGYINAHDNNGIAFAYRPVGALGLGAVLSVDTAALSSGGGSSSQLVVAIIFLLIVAAGVLLRWQALPVLRKLQVSDKNARELNQLLLRNEMRVRAVLDQVEEGIISVTSDGLIRMFNPAAEKIFGYSAQEVLGKNFSMLMMATDAERYRLRLTQYLKTGEKSLLGASREVNARRKNGDIFPVELRLGEMKLEEEHLFIGSMRDISERKEIEKRMAHLANHDSLTNLPNRNLLQDRARQALMQASRQDRRIGILFLDLDHFKTTNDLLGHPMGDRLLQTVAARILNCVRDEDTVARQGGDEFILVLPNIKRFEDVAIVAQKVLVSLAMPYSIDNTELHISASIGVSLYPDDGHDVETLMRHADTAMYYAKSTGRNNFQFFTPKMNQAVTERMSIESKLRNALGRNEFTLNYQPIVSFATGQVNAAEALLRWRPDSGPIGPDRFIPVAEETGLIVPIGEWVIRAALQERRRWLDQGLTAPRVVVNMSARQFAQKNMVAKIGRMLQEVEISPEQLGVEVTESLIMERPEDAVRTLKTLSDMGVQISIDDFGTGYSSLSYLKRFPLDKIKIDRSFISDIATDPDDAAIVTAIIVMAHSLNATVVAEGVETAEQLSFLRARGCDEFQGYYFSRPLPDDAIFEKLRIGMPSMVR